MKTTIGMLIPVSAPEIVNTWEMFQYINNDEFLKKHGKTESN
jgi:hypothetical protein